MNKQSMKQTIKHFFSRERISSAWSAAGRGVQFLILALAVQLVLSAVLLWQSSQTAQFSAAENLLALEKDDVMELRITGEENEVRLARVESGWMLSSSKDASTSFPADNTRVDTALASLSDLSAGLPVANSESSQAQLEVAEDNFQRRLRVISQDKEEQDFYLGTSPGFRKAHMRRADESAIFAAQINVYDLPASIDDWLDKNLLAFTDVKHISGERFKLELVDDTWELQEPAQLPDGKKLDMDKVTALVASLENLQVNGLSEVLEAEVATESDENTAESDSGEAAAANNESDVEAEEVQFVAGALNIGSGATDVELAYAKKGDEATLSRSDVEGVFAIAQDVVQEFSDLSLDQLLADDVPEQSDSADSQSQETGVSEAEKAMENLTEGLAAPASE